MSGSSATPSSRAPAARVVMPVTASSATAAAHVATRRMPARVVIEITWKEGVSWKLILLRGCDGRVAAR